jgi:hypothetical protein
MAVEVRAALAAAAYVCVDALFCLSLCLRSFTLSADCNACSCARSSALAPLRGWGGGTPLLLFLPPPLPLGPPWIRRELAFLPMGPRLAFPDCRLGCRGQLCHNLQPPDVALDVWDWSWISY